MPPQYDLGCTFFIPVSNLTKQAMLKNISLSFRKRSPCLRLDFVPIHCLDCRSLLMEGMDLNLVDCRQNLMIDAQIYQTGFIKVADSNGPDDPIPVHFFHRPPCAVVIGKRLMQQHKVEIVKLQFAQRFQNGFLRAQNSKICESPPG